MTSINTSPGLIDLGGYGLIISPISITQRNYYLRIIVKQKAIDLVILFGLLFAAGLAGGIEAKASNNSQAYEVVIQTWYGIMHKSDRELYCNIQKTKPIIKRYHKNATKQGKRELKRAYRYYLLDNC